MVKAKGQSVYDYPPRKNLNPELRLLRQFRDFRVLFSCGIVNLVSGVL